MGYAFHSPAVSPELRTPVPAEAYVLPGVLPPIGWVTNPYEHAQALWPGLADGNALGSKTAFTKPSTTNPYPRSRTLYIRRVVADELKKAADYEFVKSYLLGLEGQPDEYLTVNTFRGGRSNENLLSLTAFYIDLDLGIGNDEANKGQYRRYGTDFMRQLQDGLDLISEAGIPGPNLVTHTGKGTHLYWLFSRAVPARALSRWRVAMNILTEKLEVVGADKQARDASRVLRLVGTTNTSAVQNIDGVLHPWKVTAQVLNPIRYDFDFLCDQILPMTREEWQEKKKARAAKVTEFLPHQIRRGKTQAKKAPGRSYVQTAAQRLADLETLAKAAYPQGVEEGRRDTYLLHATVNLAWICRAETLETEVLRWKERFIPSWSDKDALQAMSTTMAKAYEAYRQTEKVSVFDDPRYVYSAKKVWSTFKDDIGRAGIQQQLGGIQPEGVLEARAKEKRRAARSDHYTGHGLRESNVARALEAHQLSAAGATTREIGTELGVSHKTVAKWLQIAPELLQTTPSPIEAEVIPIAPPESYPQANDAGLSPKWLLNRGVALRSPELSSKGVAAPLEVTHVPTAPPSEQGGEALSIPLHTPEPMAIKPASAAVLAFSRPAASRYSPELLEWARGLDVRSALDVLDVEFKLDLTYQPRKDHDSIRLMVFRPRDGGVHELVCTGPKFFDKSPVNPIKGGGAIDLAMQLLGLKFHETIQRILASGKVPEGLLKAP